MPNTRNLGEESKRDADSLANREARAMRLELKTGEIVILDAGYSNCNIVEVVSQTPLRLYTTVKAEDGTEWQTMTCRLTKQTVNNGTL